MFLAMTPNAAETKKKTPIPTIVSTIEKKNQSNGLLAVTMSLYVEMKEQFQGSPQWDEEKA
jgi:hypothetical protein